MSISVGAGLLWAYITSPSERGVEGVKCLICRGVARFCRLNICPYYRELLRETKISHISRVVSGPTPPSILVGEKGYPDVNVGPGVCLIEHCDAGLLETPGRWLDTSLETLLTLRLSLFHGRVRERVTEARRATRLMEALQESAASAKAVDVEVFLGGPPRFSPGFGVRSAPFGPSARAEDIKVVGNVSVPRRVDNLVRDRDVSAEESLDSLFRSGFDEYYLVRVFSAGLLGRRAERRLVPTEWSITAVDDILSRKLYKAVRKMRQINDFRLHSFQALENSAHIILTPTSWMYELLEGWLRHETVYADEEFLRPRKTYAERTGGAFYAVRLAVLRHLHSRGECAGAIVFFEVLPGWIPLGVWRFREIVRRALEMRGLKFQSLADALNELRERLHLPLDRYLSASKLIPIITQQEELPP